MSNHLFTRTGDITFQPTRHAEGAWSPEDYHFSSLAGLMINEIERTRPHKELVLSRVSYDILGRLPFAEVEVIVETLRPGRTIELVQATATIGGRSVIKARAWYLATSDTTEVEAVSAEPLTSPDECPERDLTELWAGGFIRQLEARQAMERKPGRGASWLRTPNVLVEGEEPIEVAQYFTNIDVANGINPQQGPEEWAYPNVDLTVHLFRQPTGPWTGLDTTVTWGPEGIGLTSSVLHDIHGPVGRAEQSLTLRRL
ncbi:thioesterase family protein [Corynebacterium sp.]|uniref:thioesterase family protein n=1 Tax=Corynebacterium sp. TaxID=1720 RepID=UPI0019C4FA10|nr:thioesterase family protein [Corynebacterium sp.]HHU67033.1 thioesterase family protein [Corynebacterium sp.]